MIKCDIQEAKKDYYKNGNYVFYIEELEKENKYLYDKSKILEDANNKFRKNNDNLTKQNAEMVECLMENSKLLNHLLSFPALKNCVGKMTIDMMDGQVFKIKSHTGKPIEEVLNEKS